MQKRYPPINNFVNIILDIVLGGLAILILIFMVRYLIDISQFVFKPVNSENFSTLMQEVTSFFMLFEFVMMLVRYIQEGHHIPIRYLILISVTAILRQLLVHHGDGLQTLLLSLAILMLVVVLYVLSKLGPSFHSHKNDAHESDENLF